MHATGTRPYPPEPRHSRRAAPERHLRQRPTARHLPPDVELERVRGLTVRQVKQLLEHQHAADQIRRQRRPTGHRREQISDEPVIEDRTTMLSQEREHTARRHQLTRDLAGVPQFSIQPRQPLHAADHPAPATGKITRHAEVRPTPTGVIQRPPRPRTRQGLALAWAPRSPGPRSPGPRARLRPALADLGLSDVIGDQLTSLTPSQHGTAGSLALHPWAILTWIIHRGRKEPQTKGAGRS